MMKKLLIGTGFFLLALLACKPGFCQERTKAFQLNENLGRGINMGSMFEGLSEIAWENPYNSEYFPIIAQLGFTHVRIPIRWEPTERSSPNPPYEIQESFLTRIKQVVDEALDNGLYAIINMHHHDSLYELPDRQKDRFLAQWEQIGNYFKDYPDSLLFEILNEPHGNLTSDKWNILLADALAKIRKENTERLVLIGLADWGGVSGLSTLQLPDDENIILTVHYYNPFHFTHQGANWAGEESNEWLGTEWLDTDIEREAVIGDFKAVASYSNSNKIPVHLGEFGAYSTADMDSRVRWTTYISRYMEELGFSWAYWEFSAGFGIYDPATKTTRQPLVDALLKNEMPEPKVYSRKEILTFDFTNSTDGWYVSNYSNVSSTLTSQNNELKLTVGNLGTENWHIQILRNPIELYQGKFYRISFKAYSEGQRNITAYTGKASVPWNVYSDYNEFQIIESMEEYAYYFSMETTDTDARLVFDAGSSTLTVFLDDIKIEELFFDISSVIDTQLEQGFFPNPVVDNLYLTQNPTIDLVEIYSLEGKLLLNKTIQPNTRSINLSQLKSGLYILKLFRKGKSYSFNILKK